MLGQDKSTSGTFNTGVKGTSTKGNGVVGTSMINNGVVGNSSTNTGVMGQSQSGLGVFGLSAADIGVLGSSTNWIGVAGNSTTATGVRGFSDGGIGVQVEGGLVQNGFLLPALSVNGNANNPDLIYACSHGGPDPCSVFSGSLAPQFAVVNNGNVFITGQIFTSGSCSSGCASSPSTGEKRVRLFTPQESLPTVEDYGQAQLVGGRTYVRIDPAFANTMDNHAVYMVFITPEGDNRGLYVTNKTPAGFDVRESQGGRSTLAFDYRIVAKPFGQHPARLQMITVSRPGTSLPPSRIR